MADILSMQNALKQLIIETLNLEDISPDEIETEAPLFGDGLGLDSIDALELGLAIKISMVCYCHQTAMKSVNIFTPLPH